MSKYKCVSCGAVFQMNTNPEYCPGCGNPLNEDLGIGIAETNPNITAFREIK